MRRELTHMVKTDHGDVRLAVMHCSQYEEAHIAGQWHKTIAEYQIHRDQRPMSILMRDVVASSAALRHSDGLFLPAVRH